MKFLFTRKPRKRAFSLIELSIVIVIISILLSGALSIVTSTANNAKIKATNNNINEIYKALKIYLLANKRLPCPAPITAIKSNNSNYGHSSGVAGNCSESGVYSSVANTNLAYGMVPVKDLGIAIDMAEDGYGSKFAYVVDVRYTNLYTNAINFGSDDSGYALIEVDEVTSAGAAAISQVDTLNAAFAIISYGANKSGAFGANAASQNSASSDVYEIVNGIVPIDTVTANFGDETSPHRIYAHAGRSDIFDDIVFYKTRNILVTEANAFDLIKCPAGVSESMDNGDIMTWSEGQYGQAVPAQTSCPSGYQETVLKPTKRCNAFGKWQDGFVDPCTYTATANASTLSCTNSIGGTKTTSGLNTIHTFTSSGDLVCTGVGTASYFVVGGGGGGGGANGDGGGGGGGGGGIATGDYYFSSGATIAITVGNGGTAGTSGGSATNGGTGETSSFGSVKSATGGVGGNKGGNNDGAGGASGVGDSVSKAGGGAGTCDNGHGAGGGGSSMTTAGVTGSLVYHTHTAGNGGIGTTSSVSGTSLTYGSGGGGSGGGNTSEGAKGNGGGTDGGYGQTNGTAAQAGVANRGGGGGGGGKNTSTAAAGGKGVVIVYYPTP